MKLIKIVNAYNAVEELSKTDGLTIIGKWSLYKVRKDISSHYEFYVQECQNLISGYKVEVNGSNVTFESADLAKEYKTKQNDIDNLEIDVQAVKQDVKLSDIPNITVQQIETLDEFIEFKPE